MKTNRLVFLFSFVLLASHAFGQGSLTPPGAPAPTMKTLNQIEGRTVIDPSVPGFTTPYDITQPGSYYLVGNINISNGTDAIVISADNVSLDLNGFALISTSSPAAGYGVLLSGVRKDILVRNGSIRGQVVFSGGAFSGGGFASGVDGISAPSNTRVIDLAVSRCSGYGIYLYTTATTLVERCTVQTVGSRGITAGTVSSSGSSETGTSAISCNSCFNSTGQSVGISIAGIEANVVGNSYGRSDNGTGITSRGAHATATGCYGSGSTGISVETVMNCSGVGTTGAGIHALAATNSQGSSTSGIGLQADRSASNCIGISSTGDGLDAGTVANTCYGQTGSFSAVGLKVTGPAVFSGGGNTAGGIAIQATAGIGCATYGGSTNIPAANKFFGTP